MTIEIDKHSGYFVTNLLHFGRLLREVGFRISTQQIHDLANALEWIDLSSREDFYYCTRAILLKDHKSQDLFDLAFDLFWTREFRGYIDYVITARGKTPVFEREDAGRSTEIQNDRLIRTPEEAPGGDEEANRPAMRFNPVFSPDEYLMLKDFSELTMEEFELAREYLRKIGWFFGFRSTRRKIPALKRTGNLNLYKTVKFGIRHDGEIIKLAWWQRKIKPRPVVILCDISGSMERYSSIFLYFLYGIVQGRSRVEAFVFATRLTRVTENLRFGDIQAMLPVLSKNILDWSGGTRIGESLRSFNRIWSRRVLRGSPLVIILSDGWDRGDLQLLRAEVDRLRRSVHRLIWLNPLAGSPDYQPLVAGIKTILPYVDDFLPMNNLESVIHLVNKLYRLSSKY